MRIRRATISQGWVIHGSQIFKNVKNGLNIVNAISGCLECVIKFVGESCWGGIERPPIPIFSNHLLPLSP
eukprot:1136935-Pelagomonas_calceolata.AAC.4